MPKIFEKWRIRIEYQHGFITQSVTIRFKTAIKGKKFRILSISIPVNGGRFGITLPLDLLLLTISISQNAGFFFLGAGTNLLRISFTLGMVGIGLLSLLRLHALVSCLQQFRGQAYLQNPQVHQANAKS